MMKLITYDLIKPEKDYDKLFEGIKSYGSYAHALKSVWLIKTEKSVSQIRDHLKQYIDGNDQLKIVRVADWATLNLPKNITDWMKN